MSFPVRERGLKQRKGDLADRQQDVVPRAGTWIETVKGANHGGRHKVVPRAGTWIETELARLNREDIHCRSPCGNVD